MTHQTDTLNQVIVQITAKGMVHEEEIEQIAAVIYPSSAWELAASSMGLIEEEFRYQVGERKVASESFLPKFRRILQERLGMRIEEKQQ